MPKARKMFCIRKHDPTIYWYKISNIYVAQNILGNNGGIMCINNCGKGVENFLHACRGGAKTFSRALRGGQKKLTTTDHGLTAPPLPVKNDTSLISLYIVAYHHCRNSYKRWIGDMWLAYVWVVFPQGMWSSWKGGKIISGRRAWLPFSHQSAGPGTHLLTIH